MLRTIQTHCTDFKYKVLWFFIKHSNKLFWTRQKKLRAWSYAETNQLMVFNASSTFLVHSGFILVPDQAVHDVVCVISLQSIILLKKHNTGQTCTSTLHQGHLQVDKKIECNSQQLILSLPQ